MAYFQDDDQEGGVDGEDTRLGYEMFGLFRTSVVGCRYYDGWANKNEMVKLIREPSNAYDANAIRVDNMQDAQIGHINRHLAAVMAPLIDQSHLMVEGFVQGEKGMYTMPIDVICLGPPQSRSVVANQLARFGAVHIDSADPEDIVSGGRQRRPQREKALSKYDMEQRLARLFDDFFEGDQLMPMMDPDNEVTSSLFPHQRVALAWMVQRENSTQLPAFWEMQQKTRKVNGRQTVTNMYVNLLTNYMEEERPAPMRGGILADDMGLGKTLTMIALLATNRPGVNLPPVYQGSLSGGDAVMADDAQAGTSGAGTSAPAKKEAPVFAIGNMALKYWMGNGPWASTPAVEKELVMQAGKRKRAAGKDSDDSVVVVGEVPAPEPTKGQRAKAKGKGAASSAAADSDVQVVGEVKAKKRRGAVGAIPIPPLSPPPSASGSFTTTLAKATAELRQARAGAALAAAATAAKADADAPHTPPAADGPCATLIVCPLSVLSNWVTQLEEHTRGGLSLHVYHGASKNRSVSFLMKHDIVITTYATLAQDLPASGDAHSGLLAVKWLRVVLDEGHTIKNPRTLQSRAAVALSAERRWLLSGTPVQNNLGELHGLLKFLKFFPLNDKQCFTRALERPVKHGDIRGLYKLQVLMHSIAMRRTKEMEVAGRPLLVLPNKTIHTVKVQLDKADRTKYDQLEAEGRRIIHRHLEDDTLLENYTTVLEIILRLRQTCDSASLVPEERLSQLQPLGGGAAAALDKDTLERLLGLMAQGAADECSICLEALSSPCITKCGHLFCRHCIEGVVTRSKAACPLCRSPVVLKDLVDAPELREAQAAAEADAENKAAAAAAAGGVGAKVNALIQKLLANREGVEQAGPSTSAGTGATAPIKSVVFSQFLGMLGLTQAALTTAGIPFVRIDGSTSAKARAGVLAAFQSQAPGTPEVLIISLKAGGVGMNLTAASQVHLLDPWWNLSVEEQAMDRVHRMGQTRDVTVFRYIASDTIEERVLQLQDRKRELATSLFSDKRPDAARLARIADVKLLMSL